jgi:hypothetical protein
MNTNLQLVKFRTLENVFKESNYNQGNIYMYMCVLSFSDKNTITKILIQKPYIKTLDIFLLPKWKESAC